MPLDPSTLCARTSAGDAELAAPRNGLAIAQRRLLTLLDKPVALDELSSRPGLQPDRLERDLARLAECGLIEIHRPAGSTGPMFPTARRLAPMIELPPPPTITQGPNTAARSVSRNAAGAPLVVGRRVRHGRAILVGFASLAAIGAAVWLFATPSPEPPPRATPAPRPPTVTPPPERGQASLPVPPAPAKSIDQVRALVVADPVPIRPAPTVTPTVPAATPSPPLSATTAPPQAAPAPHAAPTTTPSAPAEATMDRSTPNAAVSRDAPAPAAEPSAPPVRIATAAPVALETRIAPLTLTPLTREVPEFPREALAAGVDQGRVKARLSVDAAGRVSAVDIVEAEPRRVFERAVTRTLSRWTFAPGASGRTTDVEIAFKRD